MRRVVFGMAFVITAVARAQNPQVISGRVLGDSAKPIAGALVSVTMAPDRTFIQDTTKLDGRWRIRFEKSSGDFLVHIAAPAHVAFRKRVTTSALDSVVTVDATLKPTAPQQLAAVNVRATRPKPSRESYAPFPNEVSAERIPEGVFGAVAADMQGDLIALAATIPGLAVTSLGVSAFGLAPTQNGVTLNGLAFPGGSLPRNASTLSRFTTSTYDPSRGGFSGVETAVSLTPGDINTRRTGNLTLDAPPLQLTDNVSRQLGQRVTGGRGSFGGSGAWVEDKWYYNASADLGRRVSNAPSIVGADAALFPVAGVSADSVTRLLGSMRRFGIPAGSPLQRTIDDASVAVRVDHAPYKPQSFDPAPSTWALIGIGQVNRSAAQGLSLTSSSAHGSQSERQLGVLQLLYSTFVKDYSLSETRSAFSVTHSKGSPYLELPEGTVLVSSALPDGSNGASALRFGGDSRSDVDDLQWIWETRTDYMWVARGTHRLKVSAQSKVDGYSTTPSSNSLGSFTYASLADLDANRPSSFSRTLNVPSRSGAAWTGFVSLGDQFRPTPRLQVVYGARAEANRFLTAPLLNPSLESALGVQTSNTPSRLHISPRLGFSWRYGGDDRASYSVSNLGTRTSPPKGVLRGGIGEFRAAFPTQLLAGPMGATGLAGGAQRISCVGQAVPTPNWAAYAADESLIPSTCVAGVGTPYLADVAPAVDLVAPGFDAPRSWRSSLGLMTAAKGLVINLDGALSLNLNQPSVYDVNFSGVPKFTLADEGREVYTSASSIVPGNGALSSVESRRAASFGPVLSRLSDMRSFNRQLTVSLSPLQSIGSYMLSVAYTLARTTGDSRGFDGGAFSDPRVVESSRTDFDARHRVQVQAGKAFRRGYSATLFFTAASGLPYTPIVSADVNGDGRYGDRAFITNPDGVGDAALRAGMRSLLASAPGRARDCLLSQLGRGASHNSCEGPWSATASARIALANSSGPWGRRANASLSITNPLGGLDQILHGEGGLRGWGASIAPDPVLLTVRGFDAQKNRFLYDVNQRFGNTNAARSPNRLPFRITLDIQMDLGPSSARQQLERALNRGRAGRVGNRLSADSIRIRFARNVPSPYTAIIQEADSLLLSREQVESLRAADVLYRQRVDSLWMQLGRELADLPDNYDAEVATQKTEAATDRAWDTARSEMVTIRQILSPLQLTLAPWMIQYFINAPTGRILIRMYSY